MCSISWYNNLIRGRERPNDHTKLFVAPSVFWPGVVIAVAVGLWLQIGKSRVAAIITAVYGLYNTVDMSVRTGKLAGWWILLAGVCAVYYTFKFQKAWKEYSEE